jgi:DNA-binding MarR family transcriptional regulator
MVENLHQIMEEQIKQDKSIKALRGFLMQDNGCLLIATSPLHFGALSKADQPFYDFFDIQVLDPLGAEDTIALIRRNLESDQRQDLLSRFPELLPKLRSLHTLTGGTPRLVVMLYELLSTESITEVKEQFLRLIDRITPFYQDRLNDLSPQERAVLETIATMRAEWPHEAPLKTPGNIASRMRMKSAQVSSLLARLTKGLYLVSAPNPDDGRSSLYHIREGFFDLWLAMNVSRAARQRIPLLTDFFAAVYEKDEERRQKREECAPEKRGDAVDRIKPAEPRYLEEIFDLIRQWEKGRLGDVEAFSHRFQEMGEELNDETWSALKIEFLRGKMASSPMAENRSRAENPAKSSIN